jgi:hypothetical protein
MRVVAALPSRFGSDPVKAKDTIGRAISTAELCRFLGLADERRPQGGSREA